jgi:hypothetical protein
MTVMTLSDILDDLRAADQVLRKYEQRYWISSDVFYELYSQGRLDDGENLEDYTEWAGFYKIKQRREELLRQLSQQRISQLTHKAVGRIIQLTPAEPSIQITH